jgi:hypothetical protein
VNQATAVAPGWHTLLAASKPFAAFVDGRGFKLFGRSIMINLLLPSVAILCAMASVVYVLALLDLLK